MTYIKTLTFTANSSISSSLCLSGLVDDNGVSLISPKLIGFYIPGSWTTANLSFSCNNISDSSTFYPIIDSTGKEFSVNVAQSGSFIPVDPSGFEAVKFLEIRSGTLSTPVLQGALGIGCMLRKTV